MILSGILLTPTGEPYKNSSVRITANNTSPNVIMYAQKDFKTNVDGEYEIDVPNGWYHISVFSVDYRSYVNVGNIEITDETTETTINALLMIGQTAGSDPLVAQVAANAASALVSKNASAVSATQSATSATNSANSATASAGSASSASTSATTATTKASESLASANASQSSASDSSVSAASSASSAVASQASADLTVSLLSTKENTITAGTTSQFWRGDKTFQTLDKSAVGLTDVDNTSDVNKPVSTATQTALNNKLSIASSFTNSLTSGTNASVSQDIAVTPTANTTQVPIGYRVQLNYNSAFNVTTGGYMLGFESVLNTQGTGTHDKMVGNLTQLNLTGGNVTSALGFEAEISSISASTMVGGFAGYYFPNLSGVPNIANVINMAAFQNDHTEAVIRSAGPFQNQMLVEVAPPYSIGLVAGRYYTAPYDTIAASTISTNIIYLVPVYIPSRTTITKLGVQVTTAASTGGLVRLGIYRANNGQPTNLIVDAGTVATTTLGAKEITINTRLDSGTYFIAANFNIACGVNFHSGGAAQRAVMYGQSSPTTTGGGLENATYIAAAFGAFPSNGVAPVFAVTQAEPHLWFRP